MKNIKKILIAEAILFLLLAAILFFRTDLTEAIFILSLPFEFMANGLRILSLSSKIGNLISIMLYLSISFLPVGYMYYKIQGKGFEKSDLFLPIISSYLLYLLYEFINPEFLLQLMPSLLASKEAIPYLKLALSILFYTFCFGYIILRFAAKLLTAKIYKDPAYLMKNLWKILCIASGIYVFFFCFLYTFQMFVNISSVSAGDSYHNEFIILLKYGIEGILSVYSIRILLSGIKLLDTILREHLSEKEQENARELGLISRQCAIVTVLSNVFINVLQLVWAPNIKDVSYNLNISFMPLILAFSAMILSGYFREAKELHDDNEMFI